IHLEDERTWIEQIFREIQSTFLLDRILEVAIPNPVWIDLGWSVCEMKWRQIVVWSDVCLTGFTFNMRIEHVILVRGAVIITESDQGSNLQLNIRVIRVP